MKVLVPVLYAVNPIVVGIFGGAANEKSIADNVLVLVARPAIAGLADRDLVPLAAFVKPAHGGESRPVPDALHTVLEHVAHIVFVETVQTAKGNIAVGIDRHRGVERLAGHAFAGGDESGEVPVLVDFANANHIHTLRPEFRKSITLVAIG